MWPFLTFHVGKYASPMDPMGSSVPTQMIGLGLCFGIPVGASCFHEDFASETERHLGFLNLCVHTRV